MNWNPMSMIVRIKNDSSYYNRRRAAAVDVTTASTIIKCWYSFLFLTVVLRLWQNPVSAFDLAYSSTMIPTTLLLSTSSLSLSPISTTSFRHDFFLRPTRKRTTFGSVHNGHKNNIHDHHHHHLCFRCHHRRRNPSPLTSSSLCVAAPDQQDVPTRAGGSDTPLRSFRIIELKNDFASRIEASIQDGTFVSLLLRGPSSSNKQRKIKKKKSHTQINNNKKENISTLLESDNFLRGCIKQIQGRRIQIKGQQYLQVTFKYHGATDIAKNWPLLLGEKEQNNQKEVNYNLHESLISLMNYPVNNKNDNKNRNQKDSTSDLIPLSEWGEQLSDLENNQHVNGFDMEGLHHLIGIQRAILTTTQSTTELDVGFNTTTPRLKQSNTGLDQNPNTALVMDHDRVKKVPLDTKSAFLRELGLTDSNGKPRRAMSSKLRQCQKFVEIVGGLVDRVVGDKGQHHQQQSASQISVLDMGCGRGYLTFSLHSYLQDRFDSVRSVGIDMRPKLVTEINDIAQSLGSNFESLTFKEGSIDNSIQQSEQDSPLFKATYQSSSLDILIALHACDTATDDALWCGISRQANIIVVAPCCHKQIRPQLNQHLSSDNGSDHTLSDVLRHNVYRERHAEMVTDSMRALLLELAGYQVQVFEFIGGEHTAKNCMITAIRTTSSCKEMSKSKQQDLQSRLESLASIHGIYKQKLAEWMGPLYLGTESSLLLEGNKRISPGSMPAI